jgi:hypothetical protein
MGDIQIVVSSSGTQDFERTSVWHKVIKRERDESYRKIVSYALSFRTGEWLRITEPDGIPDECIQKVYL